MEDYLVETKRYKDFDIKIYQDINFEESPDDRGDEDVFLVAFHRDFEVEREGFDKYICSALIGGTIHDEDDEENAKEIKKNYHFFGLEAYIHSGIHLSLSSENNYPDRNWDVSQLGVVFVSKEQTKSRKEAKQVARDLLEEWNCGLNGAVDGFVIEKDEVSYDSCWGFVGDYRDSLIPDAEQIVDCLVEKETKERERKLKAYIKNSVPLEKRFV
jgi:hypothetical protein